MVDEVKVDGVVKQGDNDLCGLLKLLLKNGCDVLGFQLLNFRKENCKIFIIFYFRHKDSSLVFSPKVLDRVVCQILVLLIFLVLVSREVELFVSVGGLGDLASLELRGCVDRTGRSDLTIILRRFFCRFVFSDVQ